MQTTPEHLEQIRERLRKMSDLELRSRWNHAKIRLARRIA
jgi:hypothetical protein